MPIRVRFAPSPTGHLHIGGARTALINWLYACKHGGTFILRIEDTDEARSTPEMTRGILDGLSWLGISWDEGPFFQSQRQEIYRGVAQKLLSAACAYRCFCSKEALEERKARSSKPAEWKYDGRCRDLSVEESERRADSGEPFVIRCRIPKGGLEWDDLVKGPIRFESEEVEDFILLRSDSTPTYHLSVVSDDFDMHVTHVIRGEDHISNTPKQIALYLGLGADPPVFGHLPLILGLDKKKLSKRHGHTSVMSYRDDGILPLALFNFLAQLGANLGEEPFLPVGEVIQRFDFSALKKSASVFDPSRLAFINAKVIGETSPANLCGLVHPFVKALLPGISAIPQPPVAVLKTRAKDMKELAQGLVPFLSENFLFDEKGLVKVLKDPAVTPALETLLRDLQSVPEEEWSQAKLEEILRSSAEKSGVKAGTLIHPVRLFLTGRTESPGIFDVTWAMGKAGTLARLRRGLQRVRSKE